MSTSTTTTTSTTEPSRVRTATLNLLKRQEFGLVIILIVLGIIVDMVNPRFLTATNVFNLLQTVAVIGIISVGQTFVLIAGEIDLSVGSVLALAGVTAGGLYATGFDAWVAVIGGLIGGACGLVVGAVVVFGKVSSFIVTLGMLSVAQGLTLLLTGGIPQAMPTQLSFIGQGSLPGGLPISVLLFIVIVIAGQLLLTRTVFGLRVTAIGDNTTAAKVGGIPVGRTRITTFIFIGVLAALAGIVFSTQVGTADPQAGTGYELNVIAAAVIGGASLSGGRGSIVGAFFGACLLGLLQNAFVLLQLSSFLQEVSIGLVIVLAALFDQFRQGNLGSPRTMLRQILLGRSK